MAPANNGPTETMQHKDSQSDRPQNEAPVLYSVPVQPVVTASRQWRGASNTLYTSGVAVVHPGRCDRVVDSAEDEPHVEGLTQYLAGRLAVSGASVSDEVK